MRDRKLHIGYGVVYALLILWALTTIFPLGWSVMNSFKNKKMIYSNSFSLPDASSFSLDNYRNIFANYDILRAYRNSFIISGAVAASVMSKSIILFIQHKDNKSDWNSGKQFLPLHA